MTNLLTVLVAAIAATVIGALWYGPLFGKKWMALSKIQKKDVVAMKKNAGQSYAIMFVGTLVTAFVLSQFIDWTDSLSAGLGALVGFWAWLGFIATTTLGSVLWEGKPWSLWVLNASYQLVSALTMGVILGVWV